ncbi:MAG TPA: galactokinase family protein [Solirubrobacteraceae bacterium]|nr:galactokinase family protein [Solirubrobacteraceae bacterium]
MAADSEPNSPERSPAPNSPEAASSERTSPPPRSVRAFGPGRVNLMGEHTDYNEGLALAFAIGRGVRVNGRTPGPGGAGERRVRARALDLEEEDEFAIEDLGEPGGATGGKGWRAFVRGTVAELGRAGLEVPGASLEITGDVPLGAGMSSSAALEVALGLALLALGGNEGRLEGMELARLCSRVENEWSGAQTGLLDQITSIYGERDGALRIDFRTLAVERVAMELDGWKLVTLDSGERRSNASSGYNDRRNECRRACELLGVSSLREASREQVEELPAPLAARARHVLSDNERVEGAVAALRERDMPALGKLLNASHESLRDDLEVCTPRVEETVAALLDAGAAGARLLGGGFGGSVLGLLAPGRRPPRGALEVAPCGGARVLEATEGEGFEPSSEV